MKLFTIGSNGKSLRAFSNTIKTADVGCIVDVRLNNTSQLAGYSKKDDLSFVLGLLGIGYEHHPELAPDEVTLSEYKKDKDWAKYLDRFDALIVERDMLSIGQGILSHLKNPCLLCSEEETDRCHRRLIAEYWAENIPDVEIEHLR